jgi:hypothetical protein
MFGFIFTPISRNAKTGPIPVTTTSKESCPTDCPFQGSGCYAEAGPLGAIWRGLTKAGPESDFQNGRGRVKTWGADRLIKAIAKLPQGQLWRHNQAGDLVPLPGTGTIDRGFLGRLVRANRGKRGFTYTHHNVLNNPENRAAVAEAVREGFVINLSANNLRHADALADLRIAPVATVLPADAKTNTVTPAGRKVVICPATIREDVSCSSCGLCARMREAIIGFPAHGPSKAKAGAVAAS